MPCRNALCKPAAASGDEPESHPIRQTLPACCARAASGHAAAPPMSVMNSRRFTAGFLPYFEPQGSTPRVWQETAEPRDFNATYDRSGSNGVGDDRALLSLRDPYSGIRVPFSNSNCCN
jgi:hypothetical protein